MTEFRASALKAKGKNVFAGMLVCSATFAPLQAADIMDAPACGARIFVAMGFNQNYPRRENMRVPRGDLYLNGTLVGALSKNPEIAILDIPAGAVELSWVPSSYDEDTRGKTRQNPIKLVPGEKEATFVVLDWHNDTPNTAAIGYRTEVVETRDHATLARQRVAFHRPLTTPCAQDQVTAAAPSFPSTAQIPVDLPPVQSTPDPRQIAKIAPLPQIVLPPVAAKAEPSPRAAPPAPSEPQPAAPDVSEAFMASLQLYYVVNARGGAPVYSSPSAEGAPLYTFPDTTALNVVNVSADKRWLTVTIPGGIRTGFVSTAIVTSGVRAPR